MKMIPRVLKAIVIERNSYIVFNDPVETFLTVLNVPYCTMVGGTNVGVVVQV